MNRNKLIEKLVRAMSHASGVDYPPKTESEIKALDEVKTLMNKYFVEYEKSIIFTQNKE